MEKRILVVDNHPLMLKWMTHLLEKEGYQVFTAEDGLSALDLLKMVTPDIIFTDLIMPKIDGEKFCQIIRKDPKLRNTLLVVLSAMIAEEKEKILKLGADFYIPKCSFNKMADHIRSVLAEADRRGEGLKRNELIGIEDANPREITKELFENRKHFEVILRSMEEGILEVTSQGRVIYCNPSAISLVGVPEEELLASNFFNLFHEADRERIKTLFSTMDPHRKVVNGEPPLRLNGKLVSLSLLPILDEDSQTAILLVNDVSERKEMEAKLLQAQKMEAIGRLAGGIAHDFNNILTVIKGYTQLSLIDLPMNDSLRKNLEEIQKATLKASTLTRQLLAISRHQVLDLKILDLNLLLKDMDKMFQRVIGEDIELVTVLGDHLGHIRADPGQIEQVLLNLTVNARDAMPSGGRLTIETSNRVIQKASIRNHGDIPPGRYVVLSVSDTGVGMTSEVKDRIFEPFFTTKEKGKGTGLGLSTVYGIVKQSGGDIRVESEVGKGTTFQIYFPQVEGPSEVEKEALAEMDLPSGNETILVVEDEEDVRKLAVKILGRQGFDALEASNAGEALLICEQWQEPIHLILIDVVMPQMSGPQLVNRLQRYRQGFEVLYMSGHPDDTVLHHGILKKGVNYIQKPFTAEELVRKVREVLNRSMKPSTPPIPQ